MAGDTLLIDARLLDFAVTPAQHKYLKAYMEHGTGRAAARALGVHHSTVEKTISRVRAAAASAGYAPNHGMTHPVPDPFTVKGVSTLYDGDGNIRAQWVKSKIDDDARFEQLLSIIEAKCEAVQPRPQVMLDGRYIPDEDLCNLVTMTDCHVGALAWAREAGEDWDLNIAKETLTKSFIGLIRALPAAGTCIINQLGDFLHTDSLVPVTPAHGHVLDADGRYQKISEVAVDILEDVIVAALEKHRHVHVIMAEGNHDESSSVWLRVLFKRLFRDNPRITVEDTPLPYYAYQHGKVMLGFHHGHKLKPEKLPMWFATKYSRMWGETTARYGHSGHQHHLDEKDHMGMRWLQHPTIAASDAYSARGGWISPREAIGITYDRDGEAGRIFVRPKLFRNPEIPLAA
jgi:hypothetical protein